MGVASAIWRDSAPGVSEAVPRPARAASVAQDVSLDQARCSECGATGAHTALLICASPRKSGVSARYAETLAGALAQEGKTVRRWNVADHAVNGCVGCELCRRAPYACLRFEDDMQELYGLLDAADAVAIVCPVYFAGPPAQFKAVLDRLQPYWERRRGPNAQPDAAALPKRPVDLHIIGAGGDPFGNAPLQTVVRSAFGAAGFAVRSVFDRVGWGQPAAEQEKQRFEQEEGPCHG